MSDGIASLPSCFGEPPPLQMFPPPEEPLVLPEEGGDAEQLCAAALASTSLTSVTTPMHLQMDSPTDQEMPNLRSDSVLNMPLRMAPGRKAAFVVFQSPRRTVVEATEEGNDRINAGGKRYLRIPVRGLALVRPGRDLIVLPDHPLLHEQWKVVKELRGLEDDQVLFLSCPTACMEDHIDEIFATNLRLRMKAREERYAFSLLPYCTSGELKAAFRKYMPELPLCVEADDRYLENHSKGTLYLMNVPHAQGFLCHTAQEIIDATRTLGERFDKLCLKPVFGSAGRGIIFYEPTEEQAQAQAKAYNFLQGPCAIEEFLDIDKDADGELISACLHMYGNRVLTGTCQQILNGVEFAGFTFPAPDLQPEFADECIQIVHTMYGIMQPNGVWGIDCLSVKGKPVCVDINSGRFNGSHYSKIHQMMFFDPEKCNRDLVCQRALEVKPTAPVKEFLDWVRGKGWMLEEELRDCGGRFPDSEIGEGHRDPLQGVALVGYMPGVLGSLTVYGKDLHQVDTITKAIRSFLDSFGGKQLDEIPSVEAQHAPKAAEVDPWLLPPPTQRPEPQPVSGLSLRILFNCNVFSPAPLGLRHLVVAGPSVVQMLTGDPTGIMKHLKVCGIKFRTVNIRGRAVVPGFIDSHVHVTGGGGEGGAHTSVLPPELTDYTGAGVTTVVGLLGTDDLRRNTASVVSRCRALKEEGINAYCFTGGYHLPATTLMGSVESDIAFIPECLGFGELAICDNRGSHPSVHQVQQLASSIHTAAMLSNKKGVLNIHLGTPVRGAGDAGIEFIRECIETSQLPSRLFFPTHIGRTRPIFDASKKFLKEYDDVFVDITASSTAKVPAAEGLQEILSDSELPKDRICISSDSGGSMFKYGPSGEVLRLAVGSAQTLFSTFHSLVSGEMTKPAASRIAMKDLLGPFTSNPAALFGMDRLGRIEVGAQADLIVLSSDFVPAVPLPGASIAVVAESTPKSSTNVSEGVWHVMAKGEWMVKSCKPAKFGTYEEHDSDSD